MIESLMNYYTFADPFLTRFDILKIAMYLKDRNYKMFHPSYCLLFIQICGSMFYIQVIKIKGNYGRNDRRDFESVS